MYLALTWEMGHDLWRGSCQIPLIHGTNTFIKFTFIKIGVPTGQLSSTAQTKDPRLDFRGGRPTRHLPL